MRVESIHVGTPRTLEWHGKPLLTSIFKEPVEGPVMVQRHNIEGDRQSDLAVHGGEYKAVYAYAFEHYAWWRKKLGRELRPSHFGENLSISDFDEAGVCIGDAFRIGGAELEATAPRLPCFKLGLRFSDPRIVRNFAQSHRWGIYFRVLKEGPLEVGDEVFRVRRHPAEIPVYDLARVTLFDRDDLETIRRLADLEVLDPAWRSHFRKKLEGRQEEG